MDPMSMQIASNMKKIRKRRKLSLDALSDLTSVSKSMLGQMERGESSPTIATLWKVATGLQIPFSALTDERHTALHLIKKKEVEPILMEAGSFRLYPLFPDDSGRRLEILDGEMDAKTECTITAEEAGAEVFLLVYEGALRVTAEQETILVEAENAMRLLGDQPYMLQNTSGERVAFYMIFYYHH